MMTLRFQKEIVKLNKLLLSQGATVEQNVYNAVKSLSERDDKIDAALAEADRKVDQMEIDIEEECLKILALHQPVANDLRFVISVLKINAVLERISDLALSIARRSAFLAKREPAPVSVPLAAMANRAQTMVRSSLDAFVNMDVEAARAVLVADEELDALRRESEKILIEAMRKHPQSLECLLQLFSIVRHLERVGDQATNIAEGVIYLVKGEIVRHRSQAYWANAGNSETK